MIFSFNNNYRLGKPDYREKQGGYRNPGRGWYHIYTFFPGRMKVEELSWLPFENEETIALVLINISEYNRKPMDQTGIDFVDKIFQCFVRAEKEIILRIVYDNEGKGMEREPSLFSLVLKHMEQLGPIVEKYANNIMVSQGLFVGSWGEMHSSKFLSRKYLRELSQTWRKATKNSVPLAFRRPVQCRQAYGPGELAAGFFDDAILASSDHMGTFGQKLKSEAEWEESWCMEDEIDFIKSQVPNIPCGGEAVSGEEGITANDTVEMLRNMHITYLNSVHDEKILNRWKEQSYGEEQSLYHYIGNYMGYRIVVRDTSLIKRKGYSLKIILENTGFANLCDRAELKLVVQDSRGEHAIPVSSDIRNLMPGKREEILLPLEDMVERGSRFLLEMRRLKDGKIIRFANALAGEQMILGEIK